MEKANATRAWERQPELAGVWRALMTAKLGIRPGALRQAPPALAARFASQWAPVECLAGHLSRLPIELLRYLGGHARGRLWVGDHTAYEPLPAQAGGLSNVAWCSLADVADDPHACLAVTAELLDHLLGSAGEPGGACLSDGAGVTPALCELGQRIARLFPLGYGVDVRGRANPHAYFAQGVAWYAEDRIRLNVADPALERLLARSLMCSDFWDSLV